MNARHVLWVSVVLGFMVVVWWAFRGQPQEKPAETAGAQIPKEQTATDEKPRPNILLISLDTLRPDHLGCYGYSKPTSPNIDRFAKQSLLFTNCRTQSPWTLPSHMSLMTSMLPSANGVDNLNKTLPAEIETLAGILQRNGYTTAALVNNAQMKSHWGFDRGFDTWREFEVDTPASNCENITTRALDWIDQQHTDEPFFLFLHYYDTHDAYAAPLPFREQFQTTLNGDESRRICFQHRFPDRNLDDASVMADLHAAYDAEIAWLDRELGRLLSATPKNTIVILFSDHGEAFEEHGWTLHGATLYEEEIRTVLIIGGHDVAPAQIDESIMLLDVAPTILDLSGIRSPLQFQGTGLSPLWNGRSMEPRLIPSESKAVLEGRVTWSLVLYPLKAVYSLADARFELYKLPDEQTQLPMTDKVVQTALFTPLRNWVDTERFWMLNAVGSGEFETTVETTDGRFAVYVPMGLDSRRDEFEVSADGRTIRWRVFRSDSDGPKSLFVQTANPDAPLRVNFERNDLQQSEMVYIGKEKERSAALPVTVPADIPSANPVIERPFAATQTGIYVQLHRTSSTRPRASTVKPLDEQTIRKLKSLGYLQ